MSYDPQTYTSYKLSWQFYSKAGNYQFQSGLYAEALQAHRQAITLAELMLATAKDERRHPDAIHAYVISCHNLADSLLQLGKRQTAETTMRQVLDQVIELMFATDYSRCLRVEAAKALKMVSLKAFEFYQHLEQPEQAHAVFAKAAEQAQKFFNQMQPQSLSG